MKKVRSEKETIAELRDRQSELWGERMALSDRERAIDRELSEITEKLESMGVED